MVGLLEREEELGLLTGALADATHGAGSLVLVAGEAGIGKTSLIRTFRDGLPEPVRFLLGACEPLSVPVPLAPWRELVDAAGGGDLAARAPEDRLALARGVLGALASCGPVAAVVEDAHWADPLSLDVLRILARRLEHAAVLLIVTYRDDEVAANASLELLLGDLVTAPGVRRIPLRRLSAGTVEDLALRSGLDGRALLQATGGNPFLLTESIAAGGQLPVTVRDAAMARAGRLSPPAREVVEVAAVVGQRLDVALLRSLCGERGDGVQEALARGVLVGDGTSLEFRHELIREAIERHIAPPTRAELHARVLEALERRPEAADHARLAHHAELGGLTDEACRYAARAAADAERMGALQEARLQAERALRLGHSLSDGERFELLVQYTRTANFTDPDLEAGVAAGRRALELAEKLGDLSRQGRASMALASSLWSLERVQEAREAAEHAIAAFDSTGDLASLAWGYATLIRMDATSFDPAAAIGTVPRALELAEACGSSEVRLDVTVSLGLARGHRGQPVALEILQEALAEARRRGWTIRMVRAYVNLMTVAVALREHQVADQVAAEAKPVFEELHVSALPTMAIRFYRARSLLDRGRWDEALAVARTRERWWQGEFAMACAMDGLIQTRRGEAGGPELVRAAWTDLSSLVSAENARHGMLRSALVEAAWITGDLPAARAELAAARAAGVVSRFARAGGELALWAARLGVELEAPPEAPLPVRLELEGNWRQAIDAWRDLDAPYEAALAALPGDTRSARLAMTTLHQLGARASAQAFARHRAARGARATRGPRRSTVAHPAGLTRREQEVLEALETGATNAEIAQALHLSERTVAHHVSAILTKLDARTRHLAVQRARGLGLLGSTPR